MKFRGNSERNRECKYFLDYGDWIFAGLGRVFAFCQVDKRENLTSNDGGG